MKAASTLIQVFALSACLAVQASSSGELKMAGVRRAIQTIAATGASTQLMLPVEAMAADDGAAFAA
ncbi:hypothetical protein [Chelativorans xinjiangense]|uniref:hypothetical protein n=1 Tax=Chelativorans xinjiangense TaxID=2681485 RepID=UPI00135AB61A|nr:hypothetical protein [Chelativorans xinjiangense]